MFPVLPDEIEYVVPSALLKVPDVHATVSASVAEYVASNCHPLAAMFC
jgi:hypothetical protein